MVVFCGYYILQEGLVASLPSIGRWWVRLSLALFNVRCMLSFLCLRFVRVYNVNRFNVGYVVSKVQEKQVGSEKRQHS